MTWTCVGPCLAGMTWPGIPREPRRQNLCKLTILDFLVPATLTSKAYPVISSLDSWVADCRRHACARLQECIRCPYKWVQVTSCGRGPDITSLIQRQPASYGCCVGDFHYFSKLGPLLPPSCCSNIAESGGSEEPLKPPQSTVRTRRTPYFPACCTAIESCVLWRLQLATVQSQTVQQPCGLAVWDPVGLRLKPVQQQGQSRKD